MEIKTLKFIEKAKIIHADKYNYSLVKYIKSKLKIIIICPIHGEFEQRASGHLAGYGCSKCSSDKQKLDINKFIEKAKEVHGDKYDYSLVEYKTYDENINIVCPIHGQFEQTPNNHLKGSDCLKCSLNNRVINNNFVKKANKKHGDKYDYSLVNYKGFNIKVKITCKIHGEFEQTPQNHLKGQGCPICNESNGEKKIRDLLNKNGINFIPQKRFDGCKHKITLPFDFYLPEFNTCIEFNGIQHYKAIDIWGGEKKLLEQQKKDTIKKEYCNKNNLKLIIIKYNEKIDKIIKKLNKNE